MIFYRAFYTIKDKEGNKIKLRFIGKRMKQEYKSIDEINKDIKEANIKNMISYEIQTIKIINIIEVI